MIISAQLVVSGSAYIAGDNDGILTVAGKPAARAVYLLNSITLAVLQVCKSTSSGHYIFAGLDASKYYLVIARDYKGEYEPFAWDYVKPADDLTVIEQRALWASWQTT